MQWWKPFIFNCTDEVINAWPLYKAIPYMCAIAVFRLGVLGGIVWALCYLVS